MAQGSELLRRIAEALERLAPLPAPGPDLAACDAWLWDGAAGTLHPIPCVAHVDLGLLHGIDRQIGTLLGNTRAFAAGRPANNALLWGAKGTGKSATVKAVFAAVNRETPHSLALVEIPRTDIGTLPRLLELLAASPRRFVLFCDDLSFEIDDAGYKSLKAVLDGGIQGRPENVLVYATSNRRHLMPRDMIENERSSAINPAEATEEKVSLSDRFGLWLGFYSIPQETYLQIVEGYAARFGITASREALHAAANEWAITRGARSGRVALQFVQDYAGRGDFGSDGAAVRPGALNADS